MEGEQCRRPHLLALILPSSFVGCPVCVYNVSFLIENYEGK